MQLPTEGIYQIVISEVLETGSTRPLVPGDSRTFTVAAVLDLGLRMLESPRGRQGKVAIYFYLPSFHQEKRSKRNTKYGEGVP